MTSKIGMIVRYCLSNSDACTVRERRRRHVDRCDDWSDHEVFAGTDVSTGDVFPMIITRVYPETVSGQVFLNGNDTLWVEQVSEGPGYIGCWSAE